MARLIWRSRRGITVAAGLAVLLAWITWIALLDGGASSTYIHFYYIPIVMASYFLGDMGGMATSLVAALLAAALPSQYSYQPLADVVIRGMLFYFIGIMTSRLFAKLDERGREAASLLEVSRSVNASLRLNKVLQTIAQTAVQITAAKACAIRLMDRDREELLPAASYGLSLDYLAKGPVRVAESPIDQEVLAGGTLAILDVRVDPRFHYREQARAEGLVSCLCLALRRSGEVFGVLRVYSATRYQWSGGERRLLGAFAEQAALAIHNARLHDDLRRNYWETVSALARAIEARDPYTMGHSERVTDYALQLGRALDLTADQMETLRFAATLHDVGKIGLTDDIQGRGRHLDMSGEVAQRMHPLIGISILQPVEFLAPALEAVRYHHERWDGRGFSEGRGGEEIPLLARVIAVANVYDRLRTGSPGRPGLTVEEAARKLRSLGGTELNPELVEALLSAMGQGRRERAPAPEQPGGDSV